MKSNSYTWTSLYLLALKNAQQIKPYKNGQQVSLGRWAAGNALENIKHDPIAGPPPATEVDSTIESADSRATRAAERRKARRRNRQ